MANDMYRLPPGGAGKPGNGNDKDSPSLDTLVSRNVFKQLQRDPPPAIRSSHEGKANPGKPGTSGDIDLVASMAKRLSILERETKEKSLMIHRVQVENEALKAKLKVAEEEIQRRAKAAPAAGSGDGGGGDDSSGPALMRTELARLKIQLRFAWKQVAEMKSHMSEQGVAWTGDADGGEGSRHPPGGGSRVVSAESRQAGAGADVDGAPLPPRPPPEAPPAAAAGGGAAIRRRVSSPNPSGLPPAAAAAAVSASPSSHSHLSHISDASPSSLQRATSAPGEADLPTGPSYLHPHPHPHGPSPSGRASALPPLPKTPPLPGGPASSHTSSPLGPAHQGLPCSMDQLLRAVTDLNQVAGDGIGQLVGGNRNHDAHGSGAAVLHTPEAVRLILFRDGLQVHRSAPKPYSDPASQRMLQDILDGYFPYVLKAHFPDGVPIKVVDRTAEPLSAASSGSGAGAGAGGNIHSFHDLEEDSGAPEPKEHFLNRLPQTVIKNGKVIDIRGEIGRLVGAKAAAGSGAAPKADVALISTPADALLSTVQRNHVGPLALAQPAAPAAAAAGAAGAPAAASRPSLVVGAEPLPATSAAQPEIATLQVKSEDGQQTFILKLQYDDTIASLRKCIDTHRSSAKAPGAAAGAAGGGGKAKYEIRSAFPARSYTEPYETLRQAGLVPNATLFLRALQ